MLRSQAQRQAALTPRSSASRDPEPAIIGFSKAEVLQANLLNREKAMNTQSLFFLALALLFPVQLYARDKTDIMVMTNGDRLLAKSRDWMLVYSTSASITLTAPPP